MLNLFDENSDAEFDIQTNNEYAKNYDVWRKKEEINKIKTKYVDEHLISEDSSSSSDDDEDGVELTEELEKDFFKTLSCLKNKDPRIYDQNIKFFDDKSDGENAIKQKKKSKDQPLYIKDYERQLILEKGGELSDSEEIEDTRARSPTYVEEQKRLKEDLQKALINVNEDDGDDWGGMFKTRTKTKEETVKEEADYKEWLAGQRDNIENKEFESELKPLKEFWNNPNLDEGEKFLRDYILNRKFLDKEDENYIPTYDELIHDSDECLSQDEQEIENQEKFEQKFNFRFEEPDQEFIKRYPRTMENSVRKTDDRRKIKRAEIKERKQKEKEEKMQDLKKLQELKRKELEEKLEKLREITGNSDVGFKDEDLDSDFDPESHDKRMEALFNDDFYAGTEGEQKPEFPELDDELEIENWEKWEGANTEGNKVPYDQTHCEDDDFIMDCDYDPQASTQKQLIANSKGRKKRKRKSKFAEALSKPKPKFNPNDETYTKYLEEYYKFDCEDIISDLPCRFKYRNVIPNDFGLTTEEILLAKDRELNRWCSLKKAVQIRPDHIEKYEQKVFENKGKNLDLKRKVIPSLFTPEEETNTENENREIGVDKHNCQLTKPKSKTHDNTIANKSIGKRKKKRSNQIANGEEMDDLKINKDVDKKENKHVKLSGENIKNDNQSCGDEKPIHKNKKKKTSLKIHNTGVKAENSSEVGAKNTKKRDLFESSINNNNSEQLLKKKRKTDLKSKSPKVTISDARLSAYGINPKKYKNKLKYGNKS